MIHILLPHVVFSMIYQHHPDAFKKSFLGGKESNVTSFWKEMQHHPRLTKELIRIPPPPLGDLK